MKQAQSHMFSINQERNVAIYLFTASACWLRLACSIPGDSSFLLASKEDDVEGKSQKIIPNKNPPTF